jgi:hypothetical protein
MLTVFGTILPIISKPMSRASEIKELTVLTPMERFSKGLDLINDNSLLSEFKSFLNDYEAFLGWKEQMGQEGSISNESLDRESRETAARFSQFIYKALTHQSIDSDYRRFLIL